MRAQNDRAIVLRAPVCTYDIMPDVERMKRIVLGEGKAREVRRNSIAFLKTSVYDAFQSGAS